MTAETLKSLVAIPSSGGVHQQNGKSKRNIKLAMICLSTISTVICFILLGFLISNMGRIKEMEQQLETLKRTVDSMQRRLGLDYLDDLNDFEEIYSNDLFDDIHQSDLLDSFEEDDGDNEDDDDDDDGDDGDFDTFGGSGSYGIEENYDDKDIEEDVDNIYEDAAKSMNLKKRYQRSISTRMDISQSPLSNLKNIEDISNENKLSRHPDDTTKNLNIDDNIEESKIPQESHVPQSRRRNLYKHRGFRRHSHHDNKPRGRYIVKRRSSVSNRLMKNDGIQKYEEQHRSGSQTNHLPALHYILNGTLSNHENHPHHEGNPRLLHDGDVYVGHAQPWVKGLSMDKYFDIENGFVRVPENGIYLIYAQIFYHNHMDRNGFFIYHNSHPFIQCALTVPTNTLKGNTCYTSGVTYLEKNDTIHLRDLFKDRVVTLRNPKSFFGMVKLSDANKMS